MDPNEDADVIQIPILDSNNVSKPDNLVINKTK